MDHGTLKGHAGGGLVEGGEGVDVGVALSEVVLDEGLGDLLGRHVFLEGRGLRERGGGRGRV